MKSSTKKFAPQFPWLICGLLGGLVLSACRSEKEDRSSVDVEIPDGSVAVPEAQASTRNDAPKPEADSEQAASQDDEEKQDAQAEQEAKQQDEKPHPGPWLWVTRSSAGVYEEPKPDRKGKLGYVKRGGKVPILEGKVEGSNCSRGWFEVASGGFICSHVGTTDGDDPGAKFAPRQPNIDDILPYPYARNAHNGTPLYKSLPSREQMHFYEPYLPEAKKAKQELEDQRKADLEQMRQAGLGVGGAGPGEDEEEIPLWEREENLHEVTLDDLRRDADDVLAQRMMKGFYVAIDKTFNWNGRAWYKTSKGLVAPADRFWQTKGSDFQGVELDGEEWQLPVGFVFGGRKTAPLYEIDEETNQRKVVGKVKKFEAVQLQYDYKKIGNIDYFETKDGNWIRDLHVRMTTPRPRPEKVGENERWIDIDISEQTLVVYEGDRPVYATLISSGKESRIEEKDHSTPRGMWRVREKHVVATMDGNGTAAGDLPYSIEDVPYIMYFHKSYATHGAFWHRNYGVQMSHGCINLAPLDAKWLFYYADPPLPEGHHGTWSSKERPGSWVVVHD